MRYWILIACLSSIALQAQDSTMQTIVLQKPVQIYFNRVEKQEIKKLDKLPANNLSGALHLKSSAFIRNYGQPGIAGISFRGTSSSQTQVLWNGIPVNSLTLGQSDLSVQPLELVSSLSVSTGAESLENTNGGLGGVVNMNSHPAFSNDVIVTSSFASFHNKRLVVQLNNQKHEHAGEKTSASSFRFFAHHGKNDFLIRNRTLSPYEEVKQENAQVQQLGVSGDIRLIRAKSRTQISLYGMLNERDLPPVLGAVNHREHLTDNQFRAQVDWKSLGKINLYVAFAHIFDDFSYHQYATDIHSNVKSQSQHLKVKIKKIFLDYIDANAEVWLINESVISSGFSSHTSRFRPSFLLSLKRVQYNETLRWQWDFTARQEWFQNKLMTTARLHNNFTLSKKTPLKFISTLSRNYRIPTFNDLYWQPGGNSNLQSEIAHAADAGLLWKKIFKSDFSLKTVGFVNQIDNWIQWVPGQSGFTEVRNVKQVLIRGIESSLGLNKKTKWFQWQTGLRHTWAVSQELNPIDENLKGKDLIFSPRHVFSGNVEMGFNNWSLQYFQTYTAMSYLDAYNLSYMPYFAPATLGISKLFSFEEGFWSLTFFVHNLFDEEYQVMPNRPMPLRNYELRLNFIFK
ncbi:MAG: TonB-dependent receptor plug domain-containing protein [Flavobacteriales bacterium]